MEVRATLHWNIRIFRMFGFFQLDNYGKKTKYKVSKCQTYYSITLIFFFITAMPFQMIYNGILNPEQLERSVAVFYWNLWNPFIVVNLIICSVYYRHKLCKIVNELFICITIVEKLKPTDMRTSMRKHCFAFLLLLVIDVSIDYQYYKALVFCEYIELFMACAGISTFNVFMFVISSMLKEIIGGFHNFIEFMAVPVMEPEAYIIPVDNKLMGGHRAFLKNEAKAVVNHYKYLYYKIHEICHLLNDVYAVPNLLLVSHFTLGTIVEGFNFYGAIFSVKDANNAWNDAYLKLASLPWAVTGLFSLYMLIYPCVHVSNLSGEIIRLINGYLSKSKDHNDIAHELKTFALIHEKIVFSPKDVFTLNYSLILTVVGLSTTYLVILTQVAQNRKPLNWENH